jgi:ketosteroid isomerase-like protein
MRRILLLALLSGLTMGTVSSPASDSLQSIDRVVVLTRVQGEVWGAERAFARTMADRDLVAFGAHVSAEANFFGGSGAMRGKEAGVAAWTRFFEGPAAPFSWEPEVVEVLESGTLALSSGPVRDPEGKLIATFQSIWRLEKDGRWRVVFDKGGPVCEPETKP